MPIKRPDCLVNFQFHQNKQAYYYIALGLLLLAPRHHAAASSAPAPATTSAPSARTQDAAASLGIPVARYKQRAMAISAALTAMGGTFYAQYVLFIDPESVFPLSLSILICLVAVLGGVGTLWGPLVGAAVLVPLSEGTRIYLGGTGKALDLLIYGALIMIDLGGPARRASWRSPAGAPAPVRAVSLLVGVRAHQALRRRRRQPRRLVRRSRPASSSA